MVTNQKNFLIALFTCRSTKRLDQPLQDPVPVKFTTEIEQDNRAAVNTVVVAMRKDILAHMCHIRSNTLGSVTFVFFHPTSGFIQESDLMVSKITVRENVVPDCIIFTTPLPPKRSYPEIYIGLPTPSQVLGNHLGLGIVILAQCRLMPGVEQITHVTATAMKIVAMPWIVVRPNSDVGRNRRKVCLLGEQVLYCG
jgi:hypothetical protein